VDALEWAHASRFLIGQPLAAQIDAAVESGNVATLRAVHAEVVVWRAAEDVIV
jgi:hypothetical protein